MKIFPHLLLVSLVLLCICHLFPARASGFIVGWGVNSSGEVTGVPSRSISNGMLVVSGPLMTTGVVAIADHILSNAVSIAGGEFGGIALTARGTVIQWGPEIGRFSNGEPIHRYRTNGPIAINGNILSNVVSIAKGQGYGLALRQDSSVVEWDRNGAWTMFTNVVAISARKATRLILMKDGTVIEWCSDLLPPNNEPHQVLGLGNVVAIAAGGDWENAVINGGQCLALKKDGAVVAWGGYKPPPGLSNVVAVAAGMMHCLALKKDGTVYGWGVNLEGQVTGTPSEGYITNGLVRIDGQILTNVIAISANQSYGLALKYDGTVVAWGAIGVRPASVPEGLSNVVAISAGRDFCLAITTNRAVAEKFRQK
jgi:Regulator of chromosome condensation (RCC1) repeat